MKFVRMDHMSASAVVASVGGLLCMVLLVSMTIIAAYKVINTDSSSEEGNDGIFFWSGNSKREHLVSATLDE